MRLLIWSTLLACSSAYTVTPLSPRTLGSARTVRASLQESTEDKSEPGITMAGIEQFRERQRLRRAGKPLSVWSKTCDRPDYDPAAHEHEPVPPTEEQAAAADALFGTRLRDDAPDGFGEGLDRYGI